VGHVPDSIPFRLPRRPASGAASTSSASRSSWPRCWSAHRTGVHGDGSGRVLPPTLARDRPGEAADRTPEARCERPDGLPDGGRVQDGHAHEGLPDRELRRERVMSHSEFSTSGGHCGRTGRPPGLRLAELGRAGRRIEQGRSAADGGHRPDGSRHSARLLRARGDGDLAEGRHRPGGRAPRCDDRSCGVHGTGRPPRTVSEGKTASLVLVRANPLEDVGNAEQIEGSSCADATSAAATSASCWRRRESWRTRRREV